ncbi:MAG: GNAT family N-acetyltransferase [Candidatus Limnocylindrales bacterium]
MTIELRIAAPDEVEVFMAAIARAFGEELRDEDVASWRARLEPDRIFVGWDGSTAIGGGAVYSLRLTVPGGEVAAGGVTAVGVQPTHRRQGLLRQMMGRMFSQARERGEPIAILWASEASIYQRFGYGLAAFKARFDLPTERSAFRDERAPSGRMRLLERAEAERLLPPVFDAFRVARPGAWARDATWWADILADPEWHRHGGGPRYFAVHERDGRATGYTRYHLHEDWDDRGPRNVLHVYEAIALDAAAERDMWRFLCDVDLVGTVQYRLAAVDHPLLHLLLEPSALGFTLGDALWLRVLDLPAALVGRRYGAADRLVLEVSDEGLPDNAGRWELTAGAGAPSVARTAAAPDVALDVADLGAVYLGGVSFAELARAGRVTGLTADALQRADALFGSPVAPWSPMVF